MTTMTKPGDYAIVTVERQLTAAVKVRVPMDKIPEAERAARAQLKTALPALGAGTVGHSLTLWRRPTEGQMEMEPAVIVSQVFEPRGEVVPSVIPAGRAVHFLLVATYDRLPGAWQTLFDWCANEGLQLAGTNWQIYTKDCGEDRAKPETALYALLA